MVPTRSCRPRSTGSRAADTNNMRNARRWSLHLRKESKSLPREQAIIQVRKSSHSRWKVSFQARPASRRAWRMLPNRMMKTIVKTSNIRLIKMGTARANPIKSIAARALCQRRRKPRTSPATGRLPRGKLSKWRTTKRFQRRRTTPRMKMCTLNKAILHQPRKTRKYWKT